MRHPANNREVGLQAEKLAAEFVESTGDMISLTEAITRSIQAWFERNAGHQTEEQ